MYGGWAISFFILAVIFVILAIVFIALYVRCRNERNQLQASAASSAPAVNGGTTTTAPATETFVLLG